MAAVAGALEGGEEGVLGEEGAEVVGAEGETMAGRRRGDGQGVGLRGDVGDGPVCWVLVSRVGSFGCGWCWLRWINPVGDVPVIPVEAAIFGDEAGGGALVSLPSDVFGRENAQGAMLTWIPTSPPEARG